MLNEIFINILSMSTIASVVFLCILFARKFIKSKVNLKNSSLLWIIFIVVLIIPLNFESQLSIKNFIDTNRTYTLTESKDDATNQSSKTDFIAYENVQNKNINYIDLLSAIWIIVTISLILKDIYIYKSLDKEEVFEISDEVLKIFEECKFKLNIKKNIKLVIQEKIKTPSLYGIFNTKILLTKEILNFSDLELKCIFIHELNHYKDKHHVCYLLFGIIEKIHWFNPIVKIAFKIIKQDLEIITDNNVLKTNITLKEYCKTILKVATNCGLSKIEMPSISNSKTDIERRIKEMKNSNIKTSLVILVIAIITLSLITVSLASDKIVNENKIDNEIVNEIFNEIDDEIENEIVEKVEYILPLDNIKVSSPFGKRIHPITKEERLHSGIDLVAEEGTKVKAVADGVVETATYDAQKGNYVEIKHADGSVSSYQHGSAILVEVGDVIKAGDEIMLVGATGMATGPHLHFEIKNSDGEYMDVNEMIE